MPAGVSASSAQDRIPGGTDGKNKDQLKSNRESIFNVMKTGRGHVSSNLSHVAT